MASQCLRHPERSRPEGGVVEGPILSTQQQNRSLHYASLRSASVGMTDLWKALPMGVGFQPPHHALCRKYRKCRKIDFLTAVPSVDVELQPFLVDHALPQRDLAGDELVELGRRAVGGEARHLGKALLGLGIVEPALHLLVERR